MSRFFDARLLREARRERVPLILTVVLGALGGVLTVLQARVLSHVVSSVFLGGRTLSDVRLGLVALLGLACVRAATLWAGEVTASRAAVRVKSDLRERLARHLLALGPAYLRGERTGELANTAVEGVEALDAYFSQYLPQVALAALVPVTLLAFVLPLDLISGLVLLLTAPLIPLFMILIGNLADALTRRQWTALSRLSAHFLDVLQGLTTLKLFNRSREQIRVIAAVGDRYRETTLGVLRVAFLSALVLELVGTLSTAVVAVQVGLRLLYPAGALSGGLTFEQAFFVLILAPEFYGPLRALGTRFHSGIAGVTAARRIFEVLETRPVEPRTWGRGDRVTGGQGDTENALAACHPLTVPPPHRVTVSFRDVHYAYDDGARPALNGVSFEIGPGEKVALVGPTGGGKSTIAQLLLGFIEPTAGQITVGPAFCAVGDARAKPSGGPAHENAPSGIEPSGGLASPPAEASIPAQVAAIFGTGFAASRPLIAWVPQMPYLFNASVAENIGLGRPTADRAAIERAAQWAHADAFIRALPDGYDTVVGERGARLSGGQAQRIALARSYLLDAPLVILDEATANLDPESEAQVQASLEQLLAGRSALIIAHRLNTVRSADRIIVLAEGCVAEAGKHEELLARGGAYARLIEAAGGAVGPVRVDPGREASIGENLPTAIPPASHALRPPSHASRFTPAASYLTRHLLALLAPFWPWVLLSVLLGFLTIGSSVGLLAASAWIIASAALQPSIAALQVAIVGVRFFGIARGGFRYLERLASHQVTFRVLARLRVAFYAALEPLAPARLRQYRSGDLLARSVADIGALENFYIRAVAPPLVALSVIALMAVLLGSFDRRLAAAVVGLMLVAGLAAPTLAQVLSRKAGRRLPHARAALNATLVDGLQGAGDLVVFGGGPAHVARVRAQSDELGDLQRRLAAVGGLNAALGSLLTHVAVLVALALAIPLVTAGRLAGVNLAVLALATAAGFEAVLPLPLAAQFLESSLAAARRLFEIGGEALGGGDWETGATGQEEAGLGQAAGEQRPVALTVNHLTLRYAPDEPAALDDLTFHVPAGGRVAVVGPSGAGKSTLLNALLRFWDYEAGDIWLDGHELRTLAPEAVRRQIGVVTQNTHLFNATVADNLRLARRGATQAEIEAAARGAQIHDFIAALPQGYETWIGEDGLRLSGGERQRLAIARALLKDAPLLILDEATANLDTLTEQAVQAALATLTAGRTTLTLTHRLAGLASADEIWVLEAGRAVEHGRHADLLARDGLYRRLWEL